MFKKNKQKLGKSKLTVYDNTNKQENRESVHCPYCNKFYDIQKISDNEQQTEVEDLDVIKCENCKNIFGVLTKKYYDPYFSISKIAVKLWEESKG
jgi:uncharacterized protein with PIN domain